MIQPSFEAFESEDHLTPIPANGKPRTRAEELARLAAKARAILETVSAVRSMADRQEARLRLLEQEIQRAKQSAQ